MQREGKPSPAYPHAGPVTALAGLFLWSGASVKIRSSCRHSGGVPKSLLGPSCGGRGISRADVSLPLCLNAKFYPSLTMVRDQERSIISPEGRLTWTGAWKSAFANAPMRSGPNMVAWTAKPSSTGLRPNEKCWRPRRPSLPANRIPTRSHGRQHVRKPPERSRGPADAAHHIRGASPLFGGKHRSFIWF
jgi:hypothetical protein